MNVIYLNKNLQYCEAIPDNTGKVIIPELNIIVGFVKNGMLWALKDDNENILTPFETFVQFNDMSVEFIQAQHFKEENRVINLEGCNFCELKQVYSCLPFESYNTGLANFFNSTFEVENEYNRRHIFGRLDANNKPLVMKGYEVTRSKPGYITEMITYLAKERLTYFCLFGQGQADYEIKAYAENNNFGFMPAWTSSSGSTMLNHSLIKLFYKQRPSNPYQNDVITSEPWQTNTPLLAEYTEVIEMIKSNPLDTVYLNKLFGQLKPNGSIPFVFTFANLVTKLVFTNQDGEIYTAEDPEGFTEYTMHYVRVEGYLYEFEYTNLNAGITLGDELSTIDLDAGTKHTIN